MINYNIVLYIGLFLMVGGFILFLVSEHFERQADIKLFRQQQLTKSFELEKIKQDIRDFRDETFCAYSEWQSKGEPDTNENIECTCGIYDEAIDKLEEAKNND